MPRTIFVAVVAIILGTAGTVEARTEAAALNDYTPACREKEALQPLLDAFLAQDTEASAKYLLALRVVASASNACVFFDEGEKAHVYDRDLFGSWIVVAKRGQASRYYSLKKL